MDSLGDRMKAYEAEALTLVNIPPEVPYVIRLDGKNFSTFTSGLSGLGRPFSDQFREAMQRTTMDLLEKYQPLTAYTHSDEITLIFPASRDPEDPEDTRIHPYNGRVIKLLTVITGYTSVRFNYWIAQQDWSTYSEKIRSKMTSFSQTFDARLLVFPLEKAGVEMVNHLIWRSSYDCRRNGISSLARGFFSSAQLHKKNSPEMLKMLEEKGVSPKDYDPYYFRGIMYKSKLMEVEATNPKTGETVLATRSRSVEFFPDSLEASPEVVAQIMAKRLS